jgi:glutamate N-acetyltransferase/amino-acid N-acetyltransferase
MAKLSWVKGGVTAAHGFRASGVSAGIKLSRKPDMALVVSDVPAVAVGMLTRNRVKAAPVLISQARLRRGIAQGVLLNSGCANCMTGAAGWGDALTLSYDVTQALEVPSGQLLVASTGIIGRRLPVPRMRRVVPALVASLGRSGHRAAAQAILTTDLKPKEVAVSARFNGRTGTLGGMVKGAGMIAPSMATMLCVLTTDVSGDRRLLQTLLREAVEASFNRISVDGDMSTNDCVFLLANGRSGITLREGQAATRTFAVMLHAVTQRLARLIVVDGEGATRTMEIRVEGARTDADAQACARHIAFSPLVKTMLAGGDRTWAVWRLRRVRPWRGLTRTSWRYGSARSGWSRAGSRYA